MSSTLADTLASSVSSALQPLRSFSPHLDSPLAFSAYRFFSRFGFCLMVLP